MLLFWFYLHTPSTAEHFLRFQNGHEERRCIWGKNGLQESRKGCFNISADTLPEESFVAALQSVSSRPAGPTRPKSGLQTCRIQSIGPVNFSSNRPLHCSSAWRVIMVYWCVPSVYASDQIILEETMLVLSARSAVAKKKNYFIKYSITR